MVYFYTQTHSPTYIIVACIHKSHNHHPEEKMRRESHDITCGDVGETWGMCEKVSGRWEIKELESQEMRFDALEQGVEYSA